MCLPRERCPHNRTTSPAATGGGFAAGMTRRLRFKISEDSTQFMVVRARSGTRFPRRSQATTTLSSLSSITIAFVLTVTVSAQGYATACGARTDAYLEARSIIPAGMASSEGGRLVTVA